MVTRRQLLGGVLTLGGIGAGGAYLYSEHQLETVMEINPEGEIKQRTLNLPQRSYISLRFPPMHSNVWIYDPQSQEVVMGEPAGTPPVTLAQDTILDSGTYQVFAASPNVGVEIETASPTITIDREVDEKTPISVAQLISFAKELEQINDYHWLEPPQNRFNDDADLVINKPTRPWVAVVYQKEKRQHLCWDRKARDIFLTRITDQLGGSLQREFRAIRLVNNGIRSSMFIPDQLSISELSTIAEVLTKDQNLPSEFPDDLGPLTDLAQDKVGDFVWIYRQPGQLDSPTEGYVPIRIHLRVNTFDGNSVEWVGSSIEYFTPPVRVPVTQTNKYPARWEIAVPDLATHIAQELRSKFSN